MVLTFQNNIYQTSGYHLTNLVSANKVKFVLLSILISVSSCGQSSNPIPSNQPGQQLYINGHIYTVNPDQEWAEAMLVKGGKIIAIGTNQQVGTLASENATVINLKNKMVLPGFHDVHMHPLEAASDNFQFLLNTPETEAENYAAKIRQAVLKNEDSDWTLGWGFDLYTLLETRREPIEILDEISTTKPIVVMEQTSHSVWVNSKALQLAKLDGNSANPTGGIIMKGANGLPNGLLIDNAGNLIIDQAIASIPNSEENDYNGLVNYALPQLAKNGITSICDARTYWKRNHHLTWQRAEANKKLTVRVNLALWLYPLENDESQIKKMQALYSNNPNSLLKINQIKLYSDGIVINTTAAMHENYHVNLFNLPTNRGINYVSQNKISKYIKALEPFGFDFHIHAIGNRGVNEALNAIELVGSVNGRHRITHIEYVLPSDYPRFKMLNVTADAQVTGYFAQPHNWHETDEFIGAALNTANIPIKNLHENGARITLSSDWDVSELNPFIGIQNAVTRAPQELSLQEAIKAYTLNAAYVMRQEDKTGSLAVGREADFIVISQNLFNTTPHKIGKTRVLQTYLKGKLIYNRLK